MHSLYIEKFDPASGDTISTNIYKFGSWTECNKFLEENGYTDPDMFLEDPDANQTGVCIEHLPRFDAEELDPSWAAYMEQVGMSTYPV